jgi:apolipoprotein N-acyltransferase
LSPRQAFWRGWLYGIGFFGVGVSWVFISIHRFGNASIFLAALITAGFIALLALFPAFTGYFLNRYFPEINGRKLICAFPAIWVFLEWARSWMCTGFPWLLLGDSQINSPLKGFAPVYGTYGVSLAVLISSGLLINAIRNTQKRKYPPVYWSIAALAALWLTGGCLTFFTWSKPQGSPIQVSLIQGNVSQEIKWSADQLIPTLQRYYTLTQAHWNSRIIIWPEAAVPQTLQDADEFIAQMDKEAKEHHTTIILGIPFKNQQQDNYLNAVIAIGIDNDAYIKHHLVPFGEYTPVPALFKPILQFLNVRMSNLGAGLGPPKPLGVNGIKIATFICYEIVYPEFVVTHSSDIGMLLTISNDAWFGHSIASAQHLEAAQMRALEMGRPALFLSNTGLTAFIKPDGTLQSLAPPYQTAVLTGFIQPMSGKTLWQKRSMDPVLILIMLLLFATIKYKYRRQRKKRKKQNRKK